MPSDPSPPYRIDLLAKPGPFVLSARDPLIARNVHASPPSTPLSSALPSSVPPLFVSALQVREAVFIHEQQCSASEEIEPDDASSWHWVLFSPTQNNDEPIPVSTVRLTAPVLPPLDPNALPPGWTPPDYKGSKVWDGTERFVLLGRVATLREARGRGYGKVLVDEAVRFARERKEEIERAGVEEGEDERGGRWSGLIGAHAQVDKVEWYAKLGFEVDEEMGVWLEEGIKHKGMWMRV